MIVIYYKTMIAGHSTAYVRWPFAHYDLSGGKLNECEWIVPGTMEPDND